MNRNATPSSNARRRRRRRHRRRRHRRRSPGHSSDCGTCAATPSTPWQDRKRPMTRSEADKATPRPSRHSAGLLLTKSDSQKEGSELRASRRIVKRKHMCSTCESDKDRERRAITSQCAQSNNVCQTTSNHIGPKQSGIKARRKLILDSPQGVARAMHSMCAPSISGASGYNTATEKQKKCTPILVHGQHAADTHLRQAETWLMQSKQHPNKKLISGHRSGAAGQNAVFRDQKTRPVFKKHAVATPARTPAGKRTSARIRESKVTQEAKKLANATHRKLAQCEVCTMNDQRNSLYLHSAEEAGSSEACITQKKKSAESQKPSELGAQRTARIDDRKQPEFVATAGPSRIKSDGFEPSSQVSKPMTAAKCTKALQRIAGGRATRKQNAQPNASTGAATFNKEACNDMYECKDVAARDIPHNATKMVISAHRNDDAGQNTVSRDQQTPPVFGKHVATAPARTPAGKRTRAGVPESKIARGARKLPNTAQRKLVWCEVCSMSDCRNSHEQCGTREPGSSKVTQNKRSAKSRKPSELGNQCTARTGCHKQPKTIARARPGRSQSHGSKSSNQDSKPTTAAKRTKALQEITVERAARKRNAQINAPTLATPPNREACDDMYQCKDVDAGNIPNYFLEQEHWERLSDIVTPTMRTPPPNSPHLSPASTQSSYSSFSSGHVTSRRNAMAVMRSLRKRGVKAATLPCSTPKNMKHRDVKKALKGLCKLEEIMKQKRLKENCKDTSEESDNTEDEMCLDEEPFLL